MGVYSGGGAYTRRAYKINVDIKKTLLEDLVYFSCRNLLFVGISL